MARNQHCGVYEYAECNDYGACGRLIGVNVIVDCDIGVINKWRWEIPNIWYLIPAIPRAAVSVSITDLVSLDTCSRFFGYVSDFTFSYDQFFG